MLQMIRVCAVTTGLLGIMSSVALADTYRFVERNHRIQQGSGYVCQADNPSNPTRWISAYRVDRDTYDVYRQVYGNDGRLKAEFFEGTQTRENRVNVDPASVCEPLSR